MRIVTTILIVLAFWAPPLFAIVSNRFNPGLATGIGVPLGFIFGCGLGLAVIAAVAFLTRRRADLKPYYIVVALAGLAVLLLFFPANQGWFSLVR